MANHWILENSARFINYKMASLGALIMGVIVFSINYEYGWLLATTAALKQAAYTFFMGGVLLKILEWIALRIENPVVAISTSVVITTIITVTLIYMVHTMKGTPKPLESTIPTLIMAPPGFFIVATRQRRKSLGASRSEYYLLKPVNKD